MFVVYAIIFKQSLFFFFQQLCSCCCCSVAQLCLTLCDPRDCSTLRFLVLHDLLELTQIHVHWVDDAIQPSHPLSPICPIFPRIRAFSNESDGQTIEALASASVPPMNIQNWSLGWTGLISLQSKGLSRVFSNTTVQKHQFFGAQPSLWSNSHIFTWLLEKP